MKDYLIIVKNVGKIIRNSLTALFLAMKKLASEKGKRVQGQTEAEIDEHIAGMTLDTLPDGIQEEEVVEVDGKVQSILLKVIIGVASFVIVMLFPLELLLIAEIVAIYQGIEWLFTKFTVPSI